MNKVFEITFADGSEEKLYTTLVMLCKENGLTYTQVQHQIGRRGTDYTDENVTVSRRNVIKSTRSKD